MTTPQEALAASVMLIARNFEEMSQLETLLAGSRHDPKKYAEIENAGEALKKQMLVEGISIAVTVLSSVVRIADSLDRISDAIEKVARSGELVNLPEKSMGSEVAREINMGARFTDDPGPNKRERM